MDANEYQKAAVSMEIYSKAANLFIEEVTHVIPVVGFENQYSTLQNCLKLMYCVGKLNGESGEVAELVFKAFRGNLGQLTDEEIIKLAKELGDVQWYIANIADLIGYTLEDIMEMNIEKLQDRKERGVIHGYGDER